jgi:hypothetical protein
VLGTAAANAVLALGDSPQLLEQSQRAMLARLQT